MRRISLAFVSVFSFFFIGYAFADNNVVTPGDFASQVWQAINIFGGLAWAGKISVVILLIIASFKVSFLNRVIWDKIGAFKAWAAPILGIVVGLLAQGPHITWAGGFAYISAGAGAILLHELLDTVKAVPGIGDVYVELINFIEQALGGRPPSVSSHVA